MELQLVVNTEIVVGDVVHAHGAVFKVKEVLKYPGQGVDGKDVHVNVAEWVSGLEVAGYFGRGKDWNFQGNDRAVQFIEPRR